MIIRYLGFTLAGLLLFLCFALLVIGIYNEIKYSYSSLSPIKPSKASIKYHLWGTLSGSLALFVFLTTVTGNAWEALGFSVFLMVMMVFFIWLHHFVRLKTTTHLYKDKVKFSALFESEKAEDKPLKGNRNE